MRLIDTDEIEYYSDETGNEIAYKVDIDQLPTITQSGWVSVEDRLPEESDDYLVCTEGTDMFICYYLKSENVWDMSDYPYITEKISHWMPLPELPEGVEL